MPVYDAAFIARQQNLWVAISVLAIFLALAIFFVVRENFRRSGQSSTLAASADGPANELKFEERRAWLVSLAALGAAAFASLQVFNASEALLVGVAALIVVAALANPLTSRFFAITSNQRKTMTAHAALISIFAASIAVEFWANRGFPTEIVAEAAPEVPTPPAPGFEAAPYAEAAVPAEGAAPNAEVAAPAEGAAPMDAASVDRLRLASDAAAAEAQAALDEARSTVNDELRRWCQRTRRTLPAFEITNIDADGSMRARCYAVGVPLPEE